MSNAYGPNAGSAIYEFLNNMVEGATEGDVPVWNATTEQFEPGSGASPMTVVIKEADQTVNNSTTLVNDDELALPLEADERVSGNLVLRVSPSATADFKFALTVPAGATISYQAVGPRAADRLQESRAMATSSGTEVAMESRLDDFIFVEYEVLNGGTAGNLQLQWAQNTAAAVDTKVHAGSRLVGMRGNFP